MTLEEEIIIIVTPPKKPAGQTLTAESAGPEIGAHRFASRAEAIAFLAGGEATDDRS